MIAARVLGRTGPEGKTLALSVLREALDEEDPPTRLRAAEASGISVRPTRPSRSSLGCSEIAVVGGNFGGMSDLANQAGQILQRIGPNNQEAIPALLEALKTGDLNTKNQILQIFSRLGRAARKASPDLIALAVTVDGNPRTQAIQVLRQLGSTPQGGRPRAPLRTVKDGRRHTSASRSSRSSGSSGRSRRRGFRPGLLDCWGIRGPAVRNRTLQVLRRIAPQSPDGGRCRRWSGPLKDKDLNVRSRAARILGQVGAVQGGVGGSGLYRVTQGSAAPPPGSRRLPALRPTRHGGESAAPCTRRGLPFGDKDHAVRVQAVQAPRQMPAPVIADSDTWSLK